MDLNSIHNMAEWNLEIYLIKLGRIHLNHIPKSNAGISSSFMNGNKLKCASYIWIKMFCSHIRQKIHHHLCIQITLGAEIKQEIINQCFLKLHLTIHFSFFEGIMDGLNLKKRKRLGKAIYSAVCSYLIGNVYFKYITDWQLQVSIYNSLNKHWRVPEHLIIWEIGF